MKCSIVKRFGVFVVAFGLLVVWPTLASAATNNTAAISQGFLVQGEVTPGTIVSFTKDKESSTVGTANTDNVDRLVGVIGGKQLVELAGNDNQTQVVTNGSILTFVSNINGDIKIGDKITASPLSGVGMKAIEATRIVGTAQQDFSDAVQVTDQNVTDADGKPQTVKIGLLQVQVGVTHYQPVEANKSFLPEPIQRFAETVVGRSVDPIRVLVALAILFAGFGGVAILLYSSVRSSIISIGRNPLAAKAVHRSLIEVGLTTFGVLLLTVITVYLVLVI